jgi:hypothetical protein
VCQAVAVAPAPAAEAPTQPISFSSPSSRHRREEHHDVDAQRQEDAQAACLHARMGADPLQVTFSFDGGCLTFTDALHRVT